jgi:hypothetical protein
VSLLFHLRLWIFCFSDKDTISSEDEDDDNDDRWEQIVAVNNENNEERMPRNEASD